MDWWTAALGNFSNVEHSQIESIHKRPQRILDTKWNIDGDDLDFLGASFALKGSQWSDIGGEDKYTAPDGWCQSVWKTYAA